MKTLGLLLALALAGIAGGNLLSRQHTATLHEQKIAQHQVTIAMTREEVHRSLGEPAAHSADQDGRETWIYPDGLCVTYGSKRDYVISAERLEPARIVQEHGRVYEISPVSGQIVSHANDVTYLQSVGLGGPGVAKSAATPRSSVLTKQWGWKSTTSSLDKPAHH